MRRLKQGKSFQLFQGGKKSRNFLFTQKNFLMIPFQSFNTKIFIYTITNFQQLVNKYIPHTKNVKYTKQ